MPDDIRCRTCGQSETSHIEANDDQKLPGYKKSLNECLAEGDYNPNPAEIKRWEKAKDTTYRGYAS